MKFKFFNRKPSEDEEVIYSVVKSYYNEGGQEGQERITYFTIGLRESILLMNCSALLGIILHYIFF